MIEKREVEPLRALTAIRGLAAWWVVIFHFREALPADTPPIIELAASNGYLAVDLFFILSGYVIALNYGKWFTTESSPAHAYRHFLVLRLSRIYPLHALMMLLFLALPMATLLLGSSHATGPLFPGYYFLSIFLLQAWGIQGGPRWNVPAWSISTEWLAYLVFPILAVVSIRLCTTALRAALCILALLAALALASATLSMDGLKDAAGLYAPIRCLLEFATGIALFLLCATRQRAPYGTTIAILLALGCFVSYAILPIPDYALMPAGFTALIYGLSDEATSLASLLRNRALQWLGVVSYATYMCHYFFKVCTKLVLFRPAVPEGAALAAYLLAVLAASALLHTAVERPGQRWLRRRFSATAKAP